MVETRKEPSRELLLKALRWLMSLDLPVKPVASSEEGSGQATTPESTEPTSNEPR